MTAPPPSPSPRLSVALCTCNGEKFIRPQLESVARQTFPVNEIIVCDDASTDTTAGIVAEFAARSTIPVTLEINKERLGITKNFEKAISQCNGEIIFLCDQDDLWQARKVQSLVSCFSDPAIGLAFSNAQVVRDDLSPAGYRLWDSIWFNSAEQRQIREGAALPVLLRHAVAAGSTLAFRASYLPLILPIPDFPHSHDIWIALMIACAGRLFPIDEDLIQYRLHASNHVGLRLHNLLGQIQMARRQVQINAFRYTADLHQAALHRLEQSPLCPVPPQTLDLLAEKIRHSRLRDALPARRLSRLPVISSEVRNGNYSKYSYGYKSVLQDLLLR